jgi:ubiquinone/menaquinone biosynthesis C-methylase UbiE
MSAENHAVISQYDTSENLKKRMQLFSSNETESIWKKLWGLYQFSAGDRVLEIGGGNGEFWVQNIEKASSLHVTFTDQSQGMVDEARDRIGKSNFSFEAINAQSLPYEDNSLDWVIAHFMLYHLPEPEKTFAEVSSVLNPRGSLQWCSLTV